MFASNVRVTKALVGERQEGASGRRTDFDGDERLAHPVVFLFPVPGVDEPMGGLDLAVLTERSVVAALGVLHVEEECAADAQVGERALRARIARWNPRAERPPLTGDELVEALRETASRSWPQRVRLRVDGLRPRYVHELILHDIRATSGETLLHDAAFYTLNVIPQ